MNRQEFDSRIRQEVNQYVCNGREESSAFLIWFLKNFFRLDEQVSIESVCDGQDDKGIDGIYVDDEEEEIIVFQSKFSPLFQKDEGDRNLKSFTGASQWFRNEECVDSLLNSLANRELKSLIERYHINDKINSGYQTKLVFITNKVFDTNAREFLDINKESLEGYDFIDLYNKYSYIADEDIQHTPKTLILSNVDSINYQLPSGIVCKVFCIQVKELLKLDGIQDNTLFYKNVRYGLGNTRINKEIKKTIRELNQHNNFFLYNNGITMICDTLNDSGNGNITVEDYYVINGCQSLLSFYENRNKISDNLYVLLKIIKIDPNSPLIEKITYFTNNQNAINLKDLKSSDRVHLDIQRQFFELFDNQILYRIKRGDSPTGYSEVIDTDFAAQLIESLYLNNPSNSAIKEKLFGEDYTKIFSRHTTAHRIYIAKIIYDTINSNKELIENEKLRGYGLAKFTFTYLMGVVLRTDELGISLINNPEKLIPSQLEKIKASIEELWKIIVNDINASIADYTDEGDGFFDYKNVFKNRDFVKGFARRMETSHRKSLVRHPEDSFSKIFNSRD